VYYNKINLKSNNKCKTTLDFIRELPSKHSKVDMQELIDCKHLRDQQDIGYAFNKYCSSIIDKISKSNVDNNNNNKKENLSTFPFYLQQNSVSPHLGCLKLFQPKKLHL
jgi:hypothetical protein